MENQHQDCTCFFSLISPFLVLCLFPPPFQLHKAIKDGRALADFTGHTLPSVFHSTIPNTIAVTKQLHNLVGDEMLTKIKGEFVTCDQL